MSHKPQISMEDVIRADGRYPMQAFAFLNEGLAYAANRAYGQASAPDLQRHVTGGQLCEGLRDLAIERYGQLAKVVLGKWNIRQTLDFGNMVYMMIEHGFMRKTEEDSLEDFRNVYDFDKAFTIHDVFDMKE